MAGNVVARGPTMQRIGSARTGTVPVAKPKIAAKPAAKPVAKAVAKAPAKKVL